MATDKGAILIFTTVYTTLYMRQTKGDTYTMRMISNYTMHTSKYLQAMIPLTIYTVYHVSIAGEPIVPCTLSITLCLRYRLAKFIHPTGELSVPTMHASSLNTTGELNLVVLQAS